MNRTQAAHGINDLSRSCTVRPHRFSSPLPSSESNDPIREIGQTFNIQEQRALSSPEPFPLDGRRLKVNGSSRAGTHGLVTDSLGHLTISPPSKRPLSVFHVSRLLTWIVKILERPQSTVGGDVEKKRFFITFMMFSFYAVLHNTQRLLKDASVGKFKRCVPLEIWMRRNEQIFRNVLEGISFDRILLLQYLRKYFIIISVKK